MPSQMKLSQLVKLKESLTTFIKTEQVDDELDQLKQVVESIQPPVCDPEITNYITSLSSTIDQAKHLISVEVAKIPTLTSQIDSKIAEMSQKYFAANYQMELALTEEGERRTRNKAFSDDARELLTHRLQIYSDWHYPGLEIGPGSGTWTSELVGNDPLYLLDIRQSYLDEAKSQFPSAYQQRLRTYLVSENESEDLSILPQNQFGFVVSINVFDYFAFDKIRHYLEEVWKLLRPGGVFLFTYNNGERYKCAQLAENGTVSYIPKTLLATFCETHGYEVVKTFDLDNTVSWIEIRKPGELKTVKAHQAMGEIKSKSS